MPVYLDYRMGGASTIRGYDIEDLGRRILGKNQAIGTAEYSWNLVALRRIDLGFLSLRLGLDFTLFGDVGVLAIVLFVDGVTRVIIAFKLKPLKGWGWMLAGGVVSVLLAWMVGREFPVSGLWVVGTMAGISLLFSGMTTITLAGTARKVAGMVEKVA